MHKEVAEATEDPHVNLCQSAKEVYPVRAGMDHPDPSFRSLSRYRDEVLWWRPEPTASANAPELSDTATQAQKSQGERSVDFQTRQPAEKADSDRHYQISIRRELN